MTFNYYEYYVVTIVVRSLKAGSTTKFIFDPFQLLAVRRHTSVSIQADAEEALRATTQGAGGRGCRSCQREASNEAANHG
jgi:hypothetical protein